ncbi:unnamed protein product [Paramecium pentaurelia]|uniref:WD-40 repeat protein n=1 Tax=Paramecium pentaurelia TaxID=43138 RepID=A0A8S1UME2_9CILI|nr:unnamed protein product [Paramecium pentaurelia]
MNCTYHIRNPITFVCIAPHKCQCQRKLCAECQYGHGVDLKYTVPIEIYQEMAIKKLNDSKTCELTKQRTGFKSLLSQTEQMLKKILEDLSQSMIEVYNRIEQEYQSCLNFINKNTNLAESSYTELEKLVNIVEGTTLTDSNATKNFYMMELDKMMIWWDHHLKAFIEKANLRIKQIQSLIKIQPEEEDEAYQMKEDIFEIFTQIQDIDEIIYEKIIEILQRQKVSDILEFLSKTNKQSFDESLINNQENIRDVRKQIVRIKNVLRNIQDHQFNKDDYSSETYEKTRQDIINKIKDNKGIIDFIKVLVLLTSIDVKFIQCGSNALNLLVGMKVDIRNQSFENIRIKNTSLIGGNFLGCNLSGSEFDNVDISGFNLNCSQLFNCKWKNLKIHKLNKLDGHSGSVLSVQISPDKNILASSSSDKSIRLWDVKTGQQKAKLDGHRSFVVSVCFSPDGNTLASGSDDNSIRLWDVKTGLQKAKLDGHTNCINSVCFFPDGNTLASGSWDKSIRLWDVKTGQQKAKLDGHSDYIYSVSFSPDGNTLASGGKDKSILLWDIKTGLQKAKLDDNSIRLWDVKTRLSKAKLDGHTSSVYSVCFSPDGNTLASGSYDNSIRLWDVKTGLQKAKLDGHSNFVMSVCFSSDGDKLASGSFDMSIRLWDVKIGQQQAKLDGNSYAVNSVCFSPDGSTLASLSDDKQIRLWDVLTGQEIQSSNKNYKHLLTQFNTSIFQNNPIPESAYTNITILLISQQPIFQATGALILKREFINQSGVDLKPLLTQKGSYFLESLQQK